MKAGHKRFLIIRMSAIGDIILTTPVVRQLRQLYPDARIDYMVRPEYASLLQAHPDISQLLLYDTSREKEQRKRWRKHIGETQYDAILDLHANLRSRLLCNGQKTPVYRFQKHLLKRALLVRTGINLYPDSPQQLSVPGRYLEAAKELGLNPADRQLSLVLPEADRRWAEQQWSSLRRHHIGVVMAPGARHFTKRWPPHYYAELVHMLADQLGQNTLMLGGPEELSLIGEIRARCGTDILFSMVGEITLSQTLALIEKAPIFVSNDSGLMHAAAAFEIPQVALFGSTVRELGFFPVNPRATVMEVEELSCRPCSHIGRDKCPKGHFDCMNELHPAAVFSKIRQMETF